MAFTAEGSRQHKHSSRMKSFRFFIGYPFRLGDHSNYSISRNKYLFLNYISVINALMNIEHIRTFVAVYRAGSFVTVANEQNVAPSSISRAISHLEASLNARLFQRTTRHLTPTEAGESYFSRVVSLLEEMDALHASLSTDQATPRGRLRVSASVSYGQMVIAPRLRQFREQYPHIELDLLLSDGRVDLINERIDIAVRHGRLSDSSLVARKLDDTTYRLVASPTYLNKHQPLQHPEELAEHELISFAYDSFRDAWQFRQQQDTRTVPIKPSITATNAAVIRACVLDGAGIGLLADWTVHADLACGSLVELLPMWQASGITGDGSIWLLYPSNRYVPAKTRAFANFLLQRERSPLTSDYSAS